MAMILRWVLLMKRMVAVVMVMVVDGSDGSLDLMPEN